ncbi:hypothetical protein [Bradyrhizobium sp. SZCCHNRI1073]|uniref:hypothetical protein n=1 Tax=Bradyrhizobium sp. SZCCHNRI1073 TaxID=3057280 RepID=UPI0029169A5E|nr:hypothetical protein [Bradyrhizobium sp. SZCCHNRI1073]
MSEMIERGAAAVLAYLKAEHSHDGTYLCEFQGGRYAQISGEIDLQQIVRAVIEAMREPTEAMVREGGQAVWEEVDAAARRKLRDIGNWSQKEAKAAWDAMFDEMLK